MGRLQGRPDHPGGQRLLLAAQLRGSFPGGARPDLAAGGDLEADGEEIKDHHDELGIKPNFNRKPVSIKEMIKVPEEPEKYPWGKQAEPEEAPASA